MTDKLRSYGVVHRELICQYHQGRKTTPTRPRVTLPSNQILPVCTVTTATQRPIVPGPLQLGPMHMNGWVYDYNALRPEFYVLYVIDCHLIRIRNTQHFLPNNTYGFHAYYDQARDVIHGCQ